MVKWFHKCNLEWLKARQSCLTATDVKELLPITKTGRKRTVTDEHYFKVLAGKLVHLTEDDCMSTGVMARGHILEPYAIDRFNKENVFGSLRLYHWDDVVITKKEHVFGGLAFSPDAMNIVMGHEIGEGQRLINGSDATTIGEIKSYNSERHLICGFTPKEKLDERWQIATAMAVCPTISVAYLLFYNPSMERQLYIVDYSRQDLANEIEMVLEVEENWLTWLNNLSSINSHFYALGRIDEEDRIIASIMKSEELNPEGEKSVIR